jgi:hypothetical protein
MAVSRHSWVECQVCCAAAATGMCWPAYTAEAQAEHAAADSFKVSSAMRVLQARVTSIYCILMHISVQHCSGYVFTALQLPLHGSGIGDAICHRLCVSCTQRAASTLTHTRCCFTMAAASQSFNIAAAGSESCFNQRGTTLCPSGC